MALTLSYGFIKNQTGDKGVTFWPDLEFNAQRLNDHTHNGVNSSLISTSAIDSITQSILAAGWAAVSGQLGTFKQTLTVPTGIDLTKHLPRFKDVASGSILNLSVVVLTSTTFDVYINDNTVALQVAYV